MATEAQEPVVMGEADDLDEPDDEVDDEVLVTETSRLHEKDADLLDGEGYRPACTLRAPSMHLLCTLRAPLCAL